MLSGSIPSAKVLQSQPPVAPMTGAAITGAQLVGTAPGRPDGLLSPMTAAVYAEMDAAFAAADDTWSALEHRTRIAEYWSDVALQAIGRLCDAWRATSAENSAAPAAAYIAAAQGVRNAREYFVRAEHHAAQEAHERAKAALSAARVALRAEGEASQAEHEALRAEKAALQAKSEALQAESEALQAERTTLRVESASLQAEIGAHERGASAPTGAP